MPPCNKVVCLSFRLTTNLAEYFRKGLAFKVKSHLELHLRRFQSSSQILDKGDNDVLLDHVINN
jgi:hypothetical protein